MNGIFENWGLSFHAWIPVTNSTRRFSRNQHETKVQKSSNATDAFPMIITWVFLHFLYEKCLHLLLRRMQYPVLVRRKIIDGLWCTGFFLGSIFYLKLLVPGSIDFTCIGQKPTYLELGFLLHKCFYLHRAGIEIFIHGTWLRGWSTLLFFLIVHSFFQQKSYDLTTNLLIFKASLMVITNICRVLMTINGRKKIFIVKFCLVIYLIDWIYVHSLVVPDFKLWNSKGVKNDLATLICVWIWLLLEFVNEVKNIRLGYLNSNQFIETYLFYPPSKESIELKSICKKLREARPTDLDPEKDSKKVSQLWQTLACAMAMKKKIKKRREEKESPSTSESTD